VIAGPPRAAASQDPGTEVGGTVPPFLGLGVDETATGLRARVTATAGTVLLQLASDPLLAALRAPLANEVVPIPLPAERGKTVEITLSVASP